MSKGFVAVENGHVVQMFAPVAVTSNAATSDTILMEGWAHASIICGFGVGSATTISVGMCSAFTGSDRTAVTFRYAQHPGIPGGGDLLDAALAWSSTITITGSVAAVGGFAVIEIDADELDDGLPFLQVNIAAPGASKIAAVYAVLSGGRYQEDITATVIA